MKNNKYLLLICIIAFGPTSAFSSSKHFKVLKDKVDEFENSVIKDFSFAVPDDYEYNDKNQMKLGILLEEKFTEQRKLFFKAEEGLFKIEDSLIKKVERGLLTQKEADRLITSVEYARRIILYTRKTEVHSQYAKIKKKMTITPDLNNLYQKFSKIDLPGNCKIQKTKLELDKGLLTFEVSGLDQDGNKQTTAYNISQDELDQGLLTTRYERGEHMGNKDKMILRFNKMNQDESVSSFSLFENKQGEYYHAEFFHDEIHTPFINILGILKLGSSVVDKEIKCYKDGPRPASIQSKLSAEPKK